MVDKPPDLASSGTVLGPGRVNVEASESDGELLRRFRAGRTEALAKVIARHQTAIRRLLLMLWGDRHEVDDLCQDVFVRLIQNPPEMDPAENLRPWLYRIAVNLVRDRARRRKIRRWFGLGRDVEQTQDRRVTAKAVAGAMEQQELVERLKSEIHGLPQPWREVVVLRDIQGLPPSEVATLLGVSVKVVNDRLYRARRELAERLEAQRGPD